MHSTAKPLTGRRGLREACAVGKAALLSVAPREAGARRRGPRRLHQWRGAREEAAESVTCSLETALPRGTGWKQARAAERPGGGGTAAWFRGSAGAGRLRARMLGRAAAARGGRAGASPREGGGGWRCAPGMPAALRDPGCGTGTWALPAGQPGAVAEARQSRHCHGDGRPAPGCHGGTWTCRAPWSGSCPPRLPVNVLRESPRGRAG